MTVFFAHARAALWHGLQQLPMECGQTMLVPDYICEVVLHPLENLGIRAVFYPVDDRLAPDWEVIENIQSSSPAHAFLLVHYFGQPQDIERVKGFCDQHGLWLIEDNAHGHGGTLNGQPLGSFGDLGFSSPRKQLQSSSGGLLYLHGKSVEPTKDTLPVYTSSWSKDFLRRLIRPFPRLKAGLRNMLKPDPDYTDPSAFQESRIEFLRADPDSVRRILAENWSEHASFRREAWSIWGQFVFEKGLQPIWKEPHSESCPWAIPVYAKSPEDRLSWLRWGQRKGLDFFPWPSLPTEVLRYFPSDRKRWLKLFCISLNHAPRWLYAHN